MNRIDELMARIDEDPSLATPDDIDAVILYQRKQRQNFESGIKPKKGSIDGGTKVEATALLSTLGMAAPTAPTIKRRA